ncbi:hypothetical protein RCG23_21965 [Neobacillus sp. PS3-34]|uniref:hypothetical protein n=1 Tax=Neobacillus sp. PS3-34 TaxID=3070678 RepID=UPI0027E18E07|nr:hypothetical protein [Neobacillus sp. PS3-34]WML47944.1 hypothetical protein RCG23_21965 [Neobacillus sp. PS3-34]
MLLLRWSYTKKYNIKGIFDNFPSSPVIFRQIKDYYFVYRVHWDANDPPVGRSDLEQMELLLNEELGTIDFYLQRKNLHNESLDLPQNW